MDINIKLGLMIIFGIIGGKLARRFSLPNVTGYIVAGLFLGPSFFNVLNEANEPMVNFVNEFALGIIAFSIGSEFRIEDLKKLGKDVFVITIFEVLGVLLVVFSVMYFLLDKSFVFSVVIASMSAATAPAGTMMVIRQFRAYGPLTKTILPVAALDDVFCRYRQCDGHIKQKSSKESSKLLFFLEFLHKGCTVAVENFA